MNRHERAGVVGVEVLSALWRERRGAAGRRTSSRARYLYASGSALPVPHAATFIALRCLCHTLLHSTSSSLSLYPSLATARHFHYGLAGRHVR